MKMAPSLLIAILVNTFLLPATSSARDIDLAKVEKWQERHAVVLSRPDGTEFCSGGVVGDKIYTAAHCCALMVWAHTVKGFGYSFDGETTRPIKEYDLDDRGNDICRITPVYPEHSPIKPGKLVHDGNVFIDSFDPILWVINKVSYVYDDPSLHYIEVQKAYRISVWDQETVYTLVQGEAIPGTSGSLVLNRKGEYVGNLVIGLGSGDGRKWIPHVFGMALLEYSEWFDTRH